MEDRSWYYVTHEGLHAILIGKNLSQQKLLNNLIMFENSNLADYLCALNSWDRRKLRLHALDLGLKYQQLDVIGPALNNIDSDQKLIGTQLLLEYIQTNAKRSHEEQFMNSLIEIAMNSISKLMSEKAKELVENQNSLQEWQERGVIAKDSILHELFSYSNMLEILRKAQSDVVIRENIYIYRKRVKPTYA